MNCRHSSLNALSYAHDARGEKCRRTASPEAVQIIMTGLRNLEVSLFRRSFSCGTSLYCTSKRRPSVVQIGNPAYLSSNSHYYSPQTIAKIAKTSHSLAIVQIIRTGSQPGLFMNTVAPLLDPCPQTGFSSLGNTHWYFARSDNPVCEQISAQSSRRFMNNPG